MLISEEYRELNRQLHQTNDAYGVSGHKWRQKVRELSSWGRQPILDYGCGKASLAKSLGPAYMVTNYDPAIEGLDTSPEPHPVVVAGDMLEHIEPDCLTAVLADLWRVTSNKALFVVHLGPAKKTLPDGRNTHLIQKPPGWWQQTITDAGFRILETGLDRKDDPREVSFVVERAYQ